MTINREIAVVGAGIGGLAVALACAQRGAAVQVYEQARALNEVGAGIQISPNGMNVLAALGLADDIRATTMRTSAINLRDYRQGRLVSHLDLLKHGQPAGHYAIHRGDFVEKLYQACLATGVSFQFGNDVELLPSDKRVVIAADGVNSKHRSKFINDEKSTFSGQVAWRATVKNTHELPAISTVHLAPSRHLVTYPLRQGNLINIVAVQERSIWADSGWSTTDDPENLRDAFDDFSPEVCEILGRIDDCFVWGLHNFPAEKQWYTGNMVLLGDAVHPMLPFMAQGANMALEDAWILATCLARFEGNSDAFAAYQKARSLRVDHVVAASSRNAAAFHLSGVKRSIAHTVLRTADKIAPSVGIKRLDWLYGYDAAKY